MRKYLIFIVLILVTTIIVFADDSSFTRALSTCSSFSESGTVETSGMSVQSNKQILGWENDKCVYSETVNFSGISTTVTCKFSKAQINELVSVMNAYSLVQRYSTQGVDTSSLEAAQNNPVVQAWNKYLQDPSVCSMSGLEQFMQGVN